MVWGTNPCAADSDGDGCSDSRERGPDVLLGGRRGALNPWDFFDVPTPALNTSNSTATRNRAISIADLIAILYYVGTSDRGGMNANRVAYNTDLNNNGVPDGREYDRTGSTDLSKPWSSGPPNGAVSLADVIIVLAQVGTNCASAP